MIDALISRCVDLSLTFAVHRDAMKMAPRRYMLAWWWRLRGKKVRARAWFAPLLGGSRSSYQLWMKRNSIVPPTNENKRTDVALIALVDVTHGAALLDRTMESLTSEGIVPYVVGDGPCDGTVGAASLMEVANKIDWAAKPWMFSLISGDVLAAGAGDAYRSEIAETNGKIVYADDDIINSVAQREFPHFKPDWNSELFRHFDYLSGACAMQISCTEFLTAVSSGKGLSQLVAAALDGAAPRHVRQVLHHRTKRPRPSAPGIVSSLSDRAPLVSIIVPTRNRIDLLRTCIEGIATTDYPDLETIIIDNDSDDLETLEYLERLDRPDMRILRIGGPFNYSAINNRAADGARGEVLCFLNNDIEIFEPGWLWPMVSQALRDDVGAVGAQLLYKDGRIQHAGVVLGLGGAAAHGHKLVSCDDVGYFQRHQLPQYVSAVTGACMVMRRDRFLDVNGFDAANFPVAFSDVDLCLRLNQRGWQSLYEPRARLVHHESVSRGKDQDPVGAKRLAGELAALRRIWNTDQIVDPFHHPNLSPVSEQFVVKI